MEKIVNAAVQAIDYSEMSGEVLERCMYYLRVYIIIALIVCICVISAADGGNSWRCTRYLRHGRCFGTFLSPSVSSNPLYCLSA